MRSSDRNVDLLSLLLLLLLLLLSLSPLHWLLRRQHCITSHTVHITCKCLRFVVLTSVSLSLLLLLLLLLYIVQRCRGQRRAEI